MSKYDKTFNLHTIVTRVKDGTKLMKYLATKGNGDNIMKRIRDELINNPDDLDYQTSNGLTALMIASLKSPIEIFDIILNAGPKVNLKTKDNKMTALNMVLNGDWNISHREEKFQKLVKAGAKWKHYFIDGTWYSPLYQIIRLDLNDPNLKFLKLYKELGGTRLKNCLYGSITRTYTGLMLAALYNSFVMVEYFLSEGSKINYQNSRRESVLMLAASESNENSSIEMVKYLLQRGADPTLVNNKAQTATDIAFHYRDTSSNLETVQLLQKAPQVWNEECPVCFGPRVKPTAAIPCGHIFCCSCLKDLKDCPCCRTKIVEIMSVYM